MSLNLCAILRESAKLHPDKSTIILCEPEPRLARYPNTKVVDIDLDTVFTTAIVTTASNGAATRSERWLDILARADDSVVVLGEANFFP